MNINTKDNIRQALYTSANIHSNINDVTCQYVTKDNDLSKRVCSIEKLMHEVIGSEQVLFTVNTDKHRQNKLLHSTRTGKDFLYYLRSSIYEIKEHYPIHQFNPYVELFMRHVEKKEYYPLRFHDKLFEKDEVVRLVEMANELVDAIRKEARSPLFKKAREDHMRGPNKNYKKLVNYIDALFVNRSRLLILRMDLGYAEVHGWPNGTKGPVTPDQFINHREQLIKCLRKKLPESLVGYACKTEYGLDKSFHIHLLVFLKGSEVRQDVTIVRIIGEHWNNIITSGKGLYYNCNADKARYGAKCAIGMIESVNAVAREVLRTDIAPYLTKTDYYIKLVLPNGNRTFAKGNMPKPKNNRGRPRTVKINPAKDQPRQADSIRSRST